MQMRLWVKYLKKYSEALKLRGYQFNAVHEYLCF